MCVCVRAAVCALIQLCVLAELPASSWAGAALPVHAGVPVPQPAPPSAFDIYVDDDSVCASPQRRSHDAHALRAHTVTSDAELISQNPLRAFSGVQIARRPASHTTATGTATPSVPTAPPVPAKTTAEVPGAVVMKCLQEFVSGPPLSFEEYRATHMRTRRAPTQVLVICVWLNCLHNVRTCIAT